MSHKDLESIEDYSDDGEEEYSEEMEDYEVTDQIPEEPEESSGTVQLQESYGKSQSMSEN